MECPNDAPLFDLTHNATRNFLRTLANFQSLYAPIHGYVCIGLCVFGILTNLVHVVVLTRRVMRNSAVNCVLTAVAICDIGTMATYLIYISHFVILRQTTCGPTFTHGWMQFLQWHVMLSITLHTTSLWLAVAMAFIRRMTLRVAQLNSSWQRPNFAWKLCIAIYIIVAVACIPSLFVHEIDIYQGIVWEPSQPRCASLYPVNYTEPIYTFTVSKAATANNCRIFKLNIWMIGLVFKVIPCILLMFFSVGLVNKIRQTEKHRRKLTNVSLNNLNSCDSSVSGRKKSHKSDRTTTMLVVILVVFLITELPQGIISILCAIFTTDVHKYLYFYLGDILDLLSLLNSSVNFVLYCVMSSRYRQTFWLVFLPAGAHSLCITKQTATTSNFNFTTLPLQRKNSNKVRNKEYAPLATEAEEHRDECVSAAGSEDSRERVEHL
ncbi:7 transmembrane receptor [Trichostrongylus colubriformis]|uniref:7 transmembrane receptor n=1 Tax=Trichostrongylus colubriformis TaxID=6319 RepID=A0AAN8FVV8_TRICO